MLKLLLSAAVLAVSAMGFALPAVATQEDLDTIASECGQQLQLSPSGCTCIRDTAAADLTDAQQAFVAASITEDHARRGELQGKMSGDEVLGAITFMTQAPTSCATQ